MKINNIAGQKNVDAFVDYKIKLLEQSDKSMRALYRLMFSERENVFFEQSQGFKTIKTTYGQAYDKVEAVAADLKRKVACPSQSVVGLYMSNSADWIVAFWATIRAGYKPLLLNTRFADQTTEQVLSQVGAVAVVTDEKSFSVPTFCFANLSEGEPLADGEYGEEFFVVSSGTSAIKICAYSANELVQTIYNSKHVLKRNKKIKAHYDGELKLLTFLPFYHVFGFIAVYVWFGFFSRTFVALNDFGAQTILNTVKRHKVTHIFAVPLFWDTVYKQSMATIARRGEKTQKKFQKGLSIASKLDNSALGRVFSQKAFAEVRRNMFGDSVQFAISGGSAIGSRVLKFFNAIGYRLVNGYGMSEIGITSVELSDKFSCVTDCSVGSPFPSVEYKIDGGELFVKGTSCAKYILQNGVKTSLDGGWYATRDLAERKGDRYFVCGRADDLIVSVTGENINPVAMESLLATDGAELCLVSGGDKLPVLVVGVDENASESQIADVIAKLKLKIDQNELSSQIGKIVTVKGSLIRGNEFKLNRKRIANEVKSGQVASAVAAQTATADELTEFVRFCFAQALGKDAADILADSDFFTDEGGTSLDYFSLVAELQRKYPLPFMTDGVPTLKTVKEFADYIANRGNEN